MKWPLSMSFAKLISRTSDAGTARFTLKAPGELNPDQKYYWRVRAKDEKGVWGDWSDTWSFTPRGPAPPLNVRIEYDNDKNLAVLRWSPNPLGRKPISYRVYASNEKGFSISDEPFEVAAGVYDFREKKSTDLPTKFPPNFLTEVQANNLTVIGDDLGNKAYYRVVAVDRAGNLSGPSDYVAAPRPVIYSRPVTRTRVNEVYSYQALSITSLGDPRTRFIDGKEVMNYWDGERPHFQITAGPNWLRIDESTGQLSGKPNRTGQYDVTIAVTLQREERTLDPAQLQWGLEKVLEQGLTTVGTASQTFTIDVER